MSDRKGERFARALALWRRRRRQAVSDDEIGRNLRADGWSEGDLEDLRAAVYLADGRPADAASGSGVRDTRPASARTSSPAAGTPLDQLFAREYANGGRCDRCAAAFTPAPASTEATVEEARDRAADILAAGLQLKPSREAGKAPRYCERCGEVLCWECAWHSLARVRTKTGMKADDPSVYNCLYDCDGCYPTRATRRPIRALAAGEVPGGGSVPRARGGWWLRKWQVGGSEPLSAPGRQPQPPSVARRIGAQACGVCDLCLSPLTPGATQYKARRFRRAVRRGLRPERPQHEVLPSVLGMEDASWRVFGELWRRRALADPGPWALCAMCARRVRVGRSMPGSTWAWSVLGFGLLSLLVMLVFRADVPKALWSVALGLTAVGLVALTTCGIAEACPLRGIGSIAIALSLAVSAGGGVLLLAFVAVDLWASVARAGYILAASMIAAGLVGAWVVAECAPVGPIRTSRRRR